MRRRGFLAAILAAGAAPAVYRAGSLMRVAPDKLPRGLWKLSVGGVLIDGGELEFECLSIRQWSAHEFSLVEIPVDPGCWIRSTFDRPVQVPASGIISVEFGDPLGSPRRA